MKYAQKSFNHRYLLLTGLEVVMTEIKFEIPKASVVLRVFLNKIFGTFGAQIGKLSFYDPIVLAKDKTVLVKEENAVNKYVIFTANADLAQELQDPERFDKNIVPIVRYLTNDFVFAQWSYEQTWPINNRIISQALSGKYLKHQLDALEYVSNSLCSKIKYSETNKGFIPVGPAISGALWEIVGHTILSENFGSLYGNKTHKILKAILDTFERSFKRSQEPVLMRKIRFLRNKKIENNMTLIRSFFDEKVKQRLENDRANEYSDILAYLLDLDDPMTGEKISIETIKDQIMGLSAAIFDTSLSAIQTLLYHLAANPNLLRKAQEEIDLIFDNPLEPITYEKLTQLDFLARAHQEALRISPAFSVLSRYAISDTVVLGKYAVKKGDVFMIALLPLQNDPDYFHMPHVFDPDRFLPREKDKIHPGAYIPFGIGKRSCAGKGFSYIGLMTIIVNILRNFDIEIDPKHRLKLHTFSLTLQPIKLNLRFSQRAASRRNVSSHEQTEFDDRTNQRIIGTSRSVGDAISKTKQEISNVSCPIKISVDTKNEAKLNDLFIAFGSNGGFCLSLARKLAQTARSHGFFPKIIELNELVKYLRPQSAVIIITSSYNGFPPANAESFISLVNEDKIDFSDISYSIIGVGDTAWQSTYMAIPNLIHTKLERLDATEILPILYLNANEDYDSKFDRWMSEFLTLNGIRSISDEANTLNYSISKLEHRSPFSLLTDMKFAKVLQNRELIHQNTDAPSNKSTRHIQLMLPEGFRYEAGDYIYIVPTNTRHKVDKALQTLKCDAEELIIINATDSESSWLPLNKPITYWDLFSGFIDLDTVLTRKDILFLQKHADDTVKSACSDLLFLNEEEFNSQIKNRRITLVDFLSNIENARIDFCLALEILKPLKKRYYSISSGPSLNPKELSITVGVQRGPHWRGKGVFEGISSNFIASLAEEDVLGIGILRSHFKLPTSPLTPMIWVGAGTGVAPFRAFLQERLQQKKLGQELAECVVILGCQQRGFDQLYHDEFQEAEQIGVVKVYWALSRDPENSRDTGRYVQDVIRNRMEELKTLIDNAAHIYICGNAETIGKAVPLAFGEELFSKLRAEGRAFEDVWGGSG